MKTLRTQPGTTPQRQGAGRETNSATTREAAGQEGLAQAKRRVEADQDGAEGTPQ
jgi:hypothetical protein